MINRYEEAIVWHAQPNDATVLRQARKRRVDGGLWLSF